MNKQIIFQIVGGSFDQGFPVIIQINKISEKGKTMLSNYQGRLPENTEIFPAYQQWQTHYYLSPMIRSAGIRNHRIEPLPQLTKVISEDDYINSQNNLQEKMEKWLDSKEIREIQEHIIDEVYKEESAQLIIVTDNANLQRLPWQTWSLLKRRRNMEISFSSANFSG